jgi:flagellar basal-body rod modification protein FlgD
MSTIATAAATTPAPGGASLAQPKPLTSLDFLKILVAEFQNQDPTAPSDPTTFATQLVQFANLGRLESIDQAVQQPASEGLMQAASAFLGREVVAAGNQVGVKNGKATSIVYAPVKADAYSAFVYDGSGNQVDQVSLGDLPANSLQTFTWSPSSSVTDGAYGVKIVSSGQVALSGLLEQGVVQSVALSNGGVALDLGNLTVPGSAVTSVQQPQ